MGVIERIDSYYVDRHSEIDHRVYFFDLINDKPRDYFLSSIKLFSRESNKSSEYIEIIKP
jgi:hypothetical protein